MSQLQKTFENRGVIDESTPKEVLDLLESCKLYSNNEKINFLKQNIKKYDSKIASIGVRNCSDLDRKMSCLEIRDCLLDHVEMAKRNDNDTHDSGIKRDVIKLDPWFDPSYGSRPIKTFKRVVKPKSVEDRKKLILQRVEKNLESRCNSETDDLLDKIIKDGLKEIKFS